jgi:hypothetical protein
VRIIRIKIVGLQLEWAWLVSVGFCTACCMAECSSLCLRHGQGLLDLCSRGNSIEVYRPEGIVDGSRWRSICRHVSPTAHTMCSPDQAPLQAERQASAGLAVSHRSNAAATSLTCALLAFPASQELNTPRLGKSVADAASPGMPERSESPHISASADAGTLTDAAPSLHLPGNDSPTQTTHKRTCPLPPITAVDSQQAGEAGGQVSGRSRSSGDRGGHGGAGRNTHNVESTSESAHAIEGLAGDSDTDTELTQARQEMRSGRTKANHRLAHA